jgi:hypothetical protein
MLFILKKDLSAVKLNGFAGPFNPGNDLKRYLGFDERIPISMSLFNAGDREKKKYIAFRKRKFGSEINSARSNISLFSFYP